MTRRLSTRLFASLLLTLLAAGCGGGGGANGGGGDDQQDPPPETPNSPPQVVGGLRTLLAPGDNTVHTIHDDFEDPDPDDVLTLEAMLPDGSPLPSWMQFDAVAGLLSLSPGAEDIGNISVVMRATDPHGARALYFASIEVRDGLPPSSFRLVSKPGGGDQSDDHSYRPVISGEGDYVAFGSLAQNLHTDALPGQEHVFRIHLATGAITIVNKDASGATLSGDATLPSISLDGQKVALRVGNRGIRKDLTSGALFALHPVVSGGGTAGVYPAISANGNVVTWSGNAVIPGIADTNNEDDLFLTDVSNNRVERFSVTENGDETPGATIGILVSSPSATGGFVAFPFPYAPWTGTAILQVVIKNRLAGTVAHASTNAAGEAANQGAGMPSMSADGRYVAFQTQATNLDGATNDNLNVFRKDMWTGEVVLVSQRADGTRMPTGDTTALEPSISADGNWVAFKSDWDFDPRDLNGRHDIYVKNLCTGNLIWASKGTSANGGTGEAGHCHIAANGAGVVFFSSADDISAEDSNGLIDIYYMTLFNQGGGTHRDNDLTGSESSDCLRGLAGNDTMSAGGGDDILEGGPGYDQMNGGLGADRFVYFSLSAGVDRIRDFEPGPASDVLDLTYALTLPIGAAPTDYVSLTTDGYNTVVSVDADGAGTQRAPRTLVVLEGVTGLTVPQLIADGNLVLGAE